VKGVNLAGFLGFEPGSIAFPSWFALGVKCLAADLRRVGAVVKVVSGSQLA